MYSNMLGMISINFLNGALSAYCGTSADELVPYFSGGNHLYSNSLIFDDGTTPTFWSAPYQYIYQANAILEGLQSSTNVSENAKKLFLGEAKFVRSLCYFYLINLFGDVPYLTSTDYHITSLLPKTSKDQIYQQIISDLKDAQNYLPSDYALTVNERTRANRWAATALLARVYLYTEKWDSAKAQASSVIGQSDLFTLNTDLDGVFLNYGSGNFEAILQWQTNLLSGIFNATPEGNLFNPNAPPNNNPNYFLSDQQLNAFEPGDLRRIHWVDSADYNSTIYFYPHKYKIGSVQKDPNAAATENITVLRLAEQYLIRAEAETHLSDVGSALDDINMIRTRAGLSALDNTTITNQAQAMKAIMQERRVEFFAEGGNRWLDLKRTGSVDSVMTIATPLKGQGTTWQSYQQLYPIPITELNHDPNLTQNAGY